MTWDYTRDSRTDEEVFAHFKKGKQAEALIIEKLKEHTEVHIVGGDSFKKVSKYQPDIEIVLRGLLRPVEVKYTDKKLGKWISLKLNQYEYLKENHGLYLQVSKNRVCMIDLSKDKGFEKESSYCNKPVRVFKATWHNSFEVLFL